MLLAAFLGHEPSQDPNAETECQPETGMGMQQALAMAGVATVQGSEAMRAATTDLDILAAAERQFFGEVHHGFQHRQ